MAAAATNGGKAGLAMEASFGSFKASEASEGSVKDPSEAETEDAQLLAPHAQHTASPFFWSMLR